MHTPASAWRWRREGRLRIVVSPSSSAVSPSGASNPSTGSPCDTCADPGTYVFFFFGAVATGSPCDTCADPETYDRYRYVAERRGKKKVRDELKSKEG